MKKIISLLLTVLMLAGVASASVMTSSATGDPADSYVVQTAPNEDSDIQMWFNHANVKVFMEDTTPSGKDTYSIYMAKNEYQGAHVTLYSPSVTKSLITAEIGTFTAMDGSGAEMTAELFYEAYIKCENLDTTDVLGVNDPADSFIRNGVIPDPIFNIEDINQKDGPGHFTLTAGKTQTLYIKVKSELDTPSGWYSAQFNVLDNAGNVIKTATVYAYVWDFEIPEANHLQTAIFIGCGTTGLTDAQYKLYYDYLLDNRICAMDPPGGMVTTNENDETVPTSYLTNPRVTTFRVGEKNLNLQNLLSSDKVTAAYTALSASEEWDVIKDKAFFYVCDEPRSQQQKDNSTVGNLTVNQVLGRADLCANLWDGAWSLVAFDENHPYYNPGAPAVYDTTHPAPYGYPSNLALVNGTYLTTDDKSGRFDAYDDAVKGLMGDSDLNVWCNKLDVYTPHDVIVSVGYDGTRRTTKVKNMNGVISGFDCTNPASCYFDWDTKYNKSFLERFNDYQAAKAAQNVEIKHWVYQCGQGPDYTYCNHTIANTGLQTELLFWQTMQVGGTGYLYYDSTEWGSVSCEGSNNTYDGALVSNRWKPHVQTTGGAGGSTVTYYGNGVLFYGTDMRAFMRASNRNKENGSKLPVATIRVEQMRDGIEDYEMLYLYGEKYGEAAKEAFIERVSNNVVDYLSMPSFDRSDYAASMTDEDIFAQIRIELGNAIEANDTHEHTWDEGVVTVEPTYKTTGIRTYTCTECGETYSEEIPVLPPMNGDVNGDGVVNMKDLQMLKKFIAATATVDEIVYGNSDIDGDGTVGIKDIGALKSMLAGSWSYVTGGRETVLRR